MTVGVEVTFAIERTVLVTDPVAVELFHESSGRFDDFVESLARDLERELGFGGYELTSWRCRPAYGLPELATESASAHEGAEAHNLTPIGGAK
jgi:hypothetical protein